jgi:ribose transport system permease protein
MCCSLRRTSCGGRGSALGALLGALIIQMINNGIIILEIDQNYSQIIIGTVIVLAVVWDRINSVLRERRLARAARPEPEFNERKTP